MASGGALILGALLLLPPSCGGLGLWSSTRVGTLLEFGAASAMNETWGGKTSRPRESMEHFLMVCNAYAYAKPLHVYNMRSQQRLTGKVPLEYKECGDYVVWLREGDQLDFRTSSRTFSGSEDDVDVRATDYSIGIFRASGLPKSKASLLLVPHRQGSSTLSAFESHVFREIQNAQLAVVDAYQGRSFGRIRIVEEHAPEADDVRSGMNVNQSEELSWNSVIALNPGPYMLKLANDSKIDVSATGITVDRPKQKLVVLRIGVDEELQFKVGNKTALPQELFAHKQTLEGEQSQGWRAHGCLAAWGMLAFLISSAA